MSDFARRLLRWHKCNGRHDLPWLASRDPYRVWLSEIMLQQTQVNTVIPYYLRFLARFPDLESLAGSRLTEVMSMWSGLGYYARARNLHRCAQAIRDSFGGEFPREPEQLAALPGIGRSTANAIATFCFSAKAPILDGNVKRVLARVFGIEGFPGQKSVERTLWRLASDHLPKNEPAAYIQAQMDFGATHCTRAKPHCSSCPMLGICIAERTGRVGSLPTTRPKRTLPIRNTTLLVCRHATQVLLEMRPPSGIWGGLLSLPELPASADPEAYAARKLGCKVKTFRTLPKATHAFTHFRLEIQPLLADASPIPHANEAGLAWVSLDALESSPLPAPIRLILKQVSLQAGLYAQGNA